MLICRSRQPPSPHSLRPRSPTRDRTKVTLRNKKINRTFGHSKGLVGCPHTPRAGHSRVVRISITPVKLFALMRAPTCSPTRTLSPANVSFGSTMRKTVCLSIGKNVRRRGITRLWTARRYPEPKEHRVTAPAQSLPGATTGGRPGRPSTSENRATITTTEARPYSALTPRPAFSDLVNAGSGVRHVSSCRRSSNSRCAESVDLSRHQRARQGVERRVQHGAARR